MFPEIRLSDSIVLPTYLLYLSLLHCLLIFVVLKRAQALEQPRGLALDLALILMVGGFVGGRLTHVFYESPDYYQEDWMRILQFWQGGFVFYGGFLLAFTGCWLFLRWKKQSFLSWADFYAPVLALGYGLGRVSCFLAGCCYGGSCSASWAVVFPWDHSHLPRHPVQLYAVAWELSVFALLMGLEHFRGRVRLHAGQLFFIWLLFHSLGRLMMENFRDDFRGAFILGLSLSTWISLLLLVLSLGAQAFFLLPTRPSRRR